MKVFIITKQEDQEIEREELTEPNQETILNKAKEISQFNLRQAKLHEKGLINKPKVKLLIT